MTLYSLVLFLHVAAALALASALSIDALILFQLHRATTSTAAHPWLNLWSAVPRIAGSSGLLLLLSGGYLTDRMSAWSLAWSSSCRADSDRYFGRDYQQADERAAKNLCR